MWVWSVWSSLCTPSSSVRLTRHGRGQSAKEGRVRRQQILAITALQWENCLEHGRNGVGLYCAWQPQLRLPVTPAEPSLSSTQEILDSSASEAGVITQKWESNGLEQGTT